MSKKDEKDFVMPPVRVGDIVMWFPDGDANQEGQPGIVTRVYGQTISVNTFSHAYYNTTPKDGVRHVSDPRRKRAELMDNGAWDYTPQFKELTGLLDQIKALLDMK